MEFIVRSIVYFIIIYKSYATIIYNNKIHDKFIHNEIYACRCVCVYLSLESQLLITYQHTTESSGKCAGSRTWETWPDIPAHLFIICVTLGELLNLSEPHQ